LNRFPSPSSHIPSPFYHRQSPPFSPKMPRDIWTY
jgi:hypothetical protein